MIFREVKIISSSFKSLLFFFLFVSVIFSVSISSGNVTTLIISSGTITSSWDGFYGQVLFNTTSSQQIVNINGGNLTNLDLYVTTPPCANYDINSIHIIASNSSSLSTPLTPGNIPFLDNFMNDVQEKASNTFNYNDDYDLTYGSYINVPSLLFKNKTSFLEFKQGYLNDANGNLIFISNICFDCNNWNNTLSDYQIMLPRNLTHIAQYYVWVDLDYNCVTDPTPGRRRHRIRFVDVTPEINVQPFKQTEHKITVHNYGGYNEDLNVKISLSNDFCTVTSNPDFNINRGTYKDLELTIYCTKPLESTLVEIEIDNFHILEQTSFKINILGECEIDSDCDEGYFCNSEKLCEEKKEVKEECELNSDCITNLCLNGFCEKCESNTQCAWNEHCVDGTCKLIEGCGFIENHKLIPYECCFDEDCAGEKICVGNECVLKSFELFILIEDDDILIEQNDYLFRIIDNYGNSIEGVLVESNAISYSDENGYVHVQIPYDGIIDLQKENYYDKKIQLDYYKIGFFEHQHNLLTGEIIFKVYDSKGIPIRGVEVFVNGISIGLTNERGKIFYITDEKILQLSFLKDKHVIKGAVVNLEDCDCFCNLLCPFIIITIISSIILYKIRKQLFIVPAIVFVLFYYVDFNYYLIPIIISLIIFIVLSLFFSKNRNKKKN